MSDPKKLNLRLPPALYADAARLAALQGVSLNAFLTLGVRNWVAYQKRATDAAPSPLRPTAPASTAPAVNGKVGRNDPCPCGSGRKWKVCHGKP